MGKVVENFKSKKNKVRLIKASDKFYIQKVYCNSNLKDKNVYYTKMLEDKIDCAKIVYEKNLTVYYECFGQTTLLDLLTISEYKKNEKIFLDAFNKLSNYLLGFYSQTLKATNTIHIIGDVNFKNFVFNKNKVCCVDFDECEAGDIVKDLAGIIAFLLCYDKQFTDFKFSLSKKLCNVICKKFNIERKQLIIEIDNWLKFLANRRNLKINHNLITNNLINQIVLCPDSFKGTMSALEVCKIEKQAISDKLPNVKVKVVPMADGGEGTLDSIKKFTKCKVKKVECLNAIQNIVTAKYLLLENNTAFIESAEVVGLGKLQKESLPTISTTYGIGQLILDAVNNKATKIYLAIGGTCTNDCGVGLLNALGVKFFDSENNEFLPVGNTLSTIKNINFNSLEKYKNIEFICMCDVENPLYGKLGSSRIFAPQKGASPQIVEILEENVINYSKIVENCTSKNLANVKGIGAGGGIPFSILSFLNGKLEKGTDILFEISNLKEVIKNTDFIITGEGCLDKQSFMGKVIGSIIDISKENNKNVGTICGKIELNNKELQKKGVKCAEQTNKTFFEFDEIKKTCKKDLYNATVELIENNLLI